MLSPGGFTGWHSHPGPVLITVKSGAATVPTIRIARRSFMQRAARLPSLQTSTTILPTRAQTVWNYWTPTSFPKGRRRAKSSRNHRSARCDLDC